MTQKTVTREEMTQLLVDQGRGILMSLGIPLTAEMGQTPWLPGSDNGDEGKPLLDVGKLADIVHDLKHDQDQIVASMGQLGHGAGLCDDLVNCPPCRDQRRVFATKLAPQIERAALAQAGTEIDQACQWAKVPQLRDQVSQVVSAYRLAGSPGAEDTDFEIIIEGVSVNGQH